ncbi:hypothetical protein EQW76_28015 [Rhizobium sp. rho-13.1]|nr:hypothetical protein EQW76_28015 [Rhizobium sp. rho-13.1]TQY05580.1 hypothetical protein EQW74_27235 [Rhizobium sp. rho-1.1]
MVLPCGGGMMLAIRLLQDNLSLHSVLEGLKACRCMGLRYSAGAQSLEVAPFSNRNTWDGAHLLRAYARPRLLPSGTSIGAESSAYLAASTGYAVIRHEEASSLLDEALPDQDMVALLHYDLDRELPVLCAALDGMSFYIGILGSRKMHDRRSEALKDLRWHRRNRTHRGTNPRDCQGSGCKHPRPLRARRRCLRGFA